MRYRLLILALISVALGGCSEGILDPKGPIALATGNFKNTTLPNTTAPEVDLSPVPLHAVSAGTAEPEMASTDPAIATSPALRPIRR